MTKTGMIVSGLALVALVGAVAVAVETGGFTTLLSSVTTGPDGDQTDISSAAPLREPEVEQPGTIEPVPAPAPAPATAPATATAQLPAPTPPASVSNDSTSGAETAPVLDETGSTPSAQAGGRVTAAEILVPDAESGATRTPLTADERDAVARGLRELGLTAANATPTSQSEQAATAELNRKALADSIAQEARARQLQAQSQR